MLPDKLIQIAVDRVRIIAEIGLIGRRDGRQRYESLPDG